MSWALTVILLSLSLNNFSEARHEKRLPSAVVVGTVYCDTCFQQDFSKTSHFISGALVAVECGVISNKPIFRKEVKTNEHGEFKVHLPFSVAKHVKKIKACSVKLIRSSEPYCAVASTATSSSLHLKSRKQGTHIFSAGFFTFKPLKQPDLCSQKPSNLNFRKPNSLKALNLNPNDPTLPPTIQDPPMPFLPPIDQGNLPPLPQIPNLPRLPPLPGLPLIPPVTKKKTSQFSNEKTFGFPFPPNPLQPPIIPPNPLLPPPAVIPPNSFLPPPSILPPNPLQPPPSVFPPIFPSPPPSIFPPILPSPSPPPSIFPPIFPPLIPIPGLTPKPTPASPPPFPFPFPPLPFPPTPGFPGIPPAASSKKSSP